MAPTDAYAIASDWYVDLALSRGTSVEQLSGDAWAVLSPEWRKSFVHNGIVVRRDPGVTQLIAWADDVLGGAGLSHRYLTARCALSAETRAGLVEAGYELQPEVLMGRPTARGPLPVVPDVVVEQVDPVEAGAFEAHLWRTEWLPGISDEEVADLVERRGSNGRSGPYLTFVVRDGGVVVAAADLAVRGSAAEIDGVATWQDYRQRSYGDALIAACVAAAAAYGCEHLYLEALDDDWPKDWYARRGWDLLGTCSTATRR